MLLILGEHDKGTGTPFAPSTVSGRRLRKLIDEIGLSAELGNVFLRRSGLTMCRNLPSVCKGYTVIALGRVAADECQRQGVAAEYLPHPAVRSNKQFERLRAGLLAIKQSESGENS